MLLPLLGEDEQASEESTSSRLKGYIMNMSYWLCLLFILPTNIDTRAHKKESEASKSAFALWSNTNCPPSLVLCSANAWGLFGYLKFLQFSVLTFKL